jgi:hypothetical protein
VLRHDTKEVEGAEIAAEMTLNGASQVTLQLAVVYATNSIIQFK